ncbi:MAG TPA: hypothetical protein VHS08_03640, partial [Candidatus Acidoferrales bacterium]|nr:hypothetical protein [Candidatus Acidoferrales bacterium]
MGLCNRGTWVFVFCLFATPIANSAGNATDPLARECGIGENRPAQRTFANPEGKKNAWREYRSENDAPEIQTFGQFAQAWTGPDGSALIRMYEPSEDWATYTEYCFSKIGQL